MTKQAVKAPRTIGLNLAELTLRERSALSWGFEKSEARNYAERAAKALARKTLGVSIEEFIDFAPETFAERSRYEPEDLVYFETEGLVFKYTEPMNGRPETLVIADRCTQCDDGVALVMTIHQLSDVARYLHFGGLKDAICWECQNKAKTA